MLLKWFSICLTEMILSNNYWNLLYYRGNFWSSDGQLLQENKSPFAIRPNQNFHFWNVILVSLRCSVRFLNCWTTIFYHQRWNVLPYSYFVIGKKKLKKDKWNVCNQIRDNSWELVLSRICCHENQIRDNSWSAFLLKTEFVILWESYIFNQYYLMCEWHRVK